MNNWQEIGYGLEVKVIGQEVGIRPQGQTSDYPHSTMIVNDQGNVINFYTEPQAKLSVEGAYYFTNLVSKEISKLVRR